MPKPLTQRAFDRVMQRRSRSLGRLASSASAKPRNPVFLIGAFRSGTTLLTDLVGMHRDVAHWSEANEIFDPGWYPWRPESAYQAPLEYDPHAFTQRWWEENRERSGEIAATFAAYQRLQRTSHFLNKSPYNTFRIPQLLEWFPTAKLVHIRRDGRAVAYSHAVKLVNEGKLREWPEPHRSRFEESFDELVVWMGAFWKEAVDEVAQQDDSLGLTDSGVMVNLTYEELCDDPMAVLDSVCGFVGLDPGRFPSWVHQERIDSRNHKWKEHVSAEVIDRAVALMEPTLSTCGYA